MAQGNTKEVFEFFGIKHIMGYSQDLSDGLTKKFRRKYYLNRRYKNSQT